MNTMFETGGTGNTAKTHDWLTPPEIVQALGPFDLDPCASLNQPWRTAITQYTVQDDGLSKEWIGRVWCNPPYGPHSAQWLKRCAAHRNAIALVFARTDTAVFQQTVFPNATAMLFMRGRIAFRRPDGTKSGPAGAPSVLIAFDDKGAASLLRANISPTGIDGICVPMHMSSSALKEFE